MTGNRVLYIGSCLDAGIVEERGLKSHNAAGSNRVRRLACAMRAVGYRPIVLSPSISMRARREQGSLVHPAHVRRSGGIAVIHAPAFNIPILGMLTGFVFQFMVMLRVMRRPLAGSIVYNFSPGFVLMTLWLRLKPGLAIVNNVEDVSVPKISDWSRDTEVRPVQQLVFWFCMKIIAHLADAYVVPTKRFLAYLPPKTTEVVTGCIDIPPMDYTPLPMPPLRILYAGKVEREHGIVQFVEALCLLDKMPIASQIRADISGAGPVTDWVAEKLKDLKTLKACQHGFVSSETYAQLLGNAHVCVALQDPNGRYADFKTPSKIYEFLGFAKAVIATQIGDVSALPEDALIVISELEAQEVASQIAVLAEDSSSVWELQSKARDLALTEFAFVKVGQRLEKLFGKE